MRYKAIFLDVDGTTVVHGIRSLPTPRVAAAIKRCVDGGVSVCLATSRPLHAAIAVISHLHLKGYCVVAGGSQVYDASKKKIIIEKPLPRSALAEIFAVSQEFDKKVSFFDGERDTPYKGEEFPSKVVGMYFPELEPAIIDPMLKKLEGIPDISLHRMESWNDRYECIDIVHKEASKLHGIVEVAKLLEIETKDMIGVGDGYNDFPLLMACGLKIAMGNAVPELKAIADFVAPTVDEDGVATVIEKFILS